MDPRLYHGPHRTSMVLIIHGIVTLAAGVVLVAAPAAIPAAVHVEVPDGAFLVPYMLGAAEIAIAVLSFGATPGVVTVLVFVACDRGGCVRWEAAVGNIIIKQRSDFDLRSYGFA